MHSLMLNSYNLLLNKRNRRRRIKPDINVVPFVDVMLVLLLLFMALTPTLLGGINVNLPDASIQPIDTNEKHIVISIQHDETLYFMDEKIESNNLISKLKSNDLKPDTTVIIQGDKSLDYGKIMKIIGDVQNAGFYNVSLIAKSR